MHAQQHIATGRLSLSEQVPVLKTWRLVLHAVKASFILAEISRGPGQRPGAAVATGAA